MGIMIARNIQDFVDSQGKTHREVIWFGSSGKMMTKNVYQVINLKADGRVDDDIWYNDINVSNTEGGQDFYIKITHTSASNYQITIRFYNDSLLIEEFILNNGHPIEYRGTLSQEINKIEIEALDQEESVEIIFDNIYEIQKGESFNKNQQAVRDSLIQKLSTLKNELWFNYQFGMPIEQKERSKLAIDSYIITTIESQEGYKSVKSFVSKIENKNYFCDVVIETIYGDIQLSI